MTTNDDKLVVTRELGWGTVDCGDNSCLFAESRTGMRTNGGCRCFDEIDRVQRRILLAWAQRQGRLHKEAIAAAEARGAREVVERVCSSLDEWAEDDNPALDTETTMRDAIAAVCEHITEEFAPFECAEHINASDDAPTSGLKGGG